MKTVYLECKMGAAGDMLMAALYELIDDKEAFLAKMNALFPGLTVAAVPSEKCGILGTHMDVKVNGEEEISEDVSEHAHHHHDNENHEHGHHHHHDEEDHDHCHHHDEEDHEHGHHHHVHRHLADIAAIVDGLEVSGSVKEKVMDVYREIAAAESAAHGQPVEEIHFHEVGALDAVADITGVCLLMEDLGAERIVCSPINLGSGHVHCAHGILPVPAPATASLVKGIPSYTSDIPGELTTPTGAALLRTFAGSFGPMPVMCVEKTGYGMGKKNFEKANCVRAFLGAEQAEDPAKWIQREGKPAGQKIAVKNDDTMTEQAKDNSGSTGDKTVVELSANLDDMTPEQAGFALEELLAAGALDVFYQPIFMKKNRPAFLLTCICKENQADFMASEILRLTTTFGVRKRVCGRYTLSVSFDTKETPFGPVRLKTGEGYGICKTKPEYEDMARIMRETGKSWKEIEQAMKEDGR